MITHFKYHDVGIDNLNNQSHVHNGDFEILHVLDGGGTIIVKDTLYALNANTVFFINGSDAHYTSPRDVQKYVRNKIVFSGDLLMSLAKQLSADALIGRLFLSGGTAVSLSGEASAKIDECFLSLSDQNPELALDFFISIFTILKTAIQNNRKAKRIHNDVAKILSYVNQNLHNGITLDDICAYVSTSKSSLCRTFKASVGMTVVKYVELSRISRARELLIHTDSSISEIAEAVGFESFAYFSKIFKKHEGCTPSSYRKAHRAALPPPPDTPQFPVDSPRPL